MNPDLVWNFKLEEKEARCDFHGDLTLNLLLRKSNKIQKELLNFLSILSKNIECRVQKNLILDFKNINRIDSAGLAVILNCFRKIKNLGYLPQVKHLPAQAKSLAEAEGVWVLIEAFNSSAD